MGFLYMHEPNQRKPLQLLKRTIFKKDHSFSFNSQNEQVLTLISKLDPVEPRQRTMWRWPDACQEKVCSWE